jgi:UDP-N-acetylmuramate: L-alanyl-gamma-D-glutamyl-meso-diaminopimelate ligase
MDIVPRNGFLVVCNDYPLGGEIAAAARCRRLTYGDGADNDWRAVNLEFHQGRTVFEPCYRGQSEGRIEVGLIGRHNVKNALAVYALGRAIGVERAKLLDGFATFRGVKRRQEVRGERRGVLVMDDFAHHPTAVRETIEAVRSAYDGRRLWAVFEPRSNTSKRNIFEKEFAAALTLADRVVVASVHQPEKVADRERLSVENVVSEINRPGPEVRARHLAGADEIAEAIGREAQPGDLVLVMSNGGFDNVHEKILSALAG